MDVGSVLQIAVPAVLFLPWALLTAMGTRRRGHGFAMCVLAGALFPVTWAVWYVVDERPRRALS